MSNIFVTSSSDSFHFKLKRYIVVDTVQLKMYSLCVLDQVINKINSSETTLIYL